MSLYVISVLTNIMLISFIALSAYLVLIVGEVSFGQQGFFGIGAYTAATTTAVFNLGLVLALILAVTVGMVVAACLARLTLRLSGFFFSICTLSFAELFRLSMLQVRFPVSVNGQKTGPDGPEGFENIRWAFDQNISEFGFFLIVATALVILLAGLLWAERSHAFRSARLVGEDPILAQSLGLRPLTYRMGFIVMAGGLAAFGGALFAHHSTYIEPTMFSIMIGVHALGYAVIGGLALPLGPLIGAAVDIGLLESVRGLSSYRMIVFGGVIAVFLIIMPHGLLSPKVLRRIKLLWKSDNV